MRNFHDSFEIRELSIIRASSICMTVPLVQRITKNDVFYEK